jgi:hypothetical protein
MHIRKLCAASFVAIVVLVACSADEKPAGGAALGATCASNDDCAAGMYCPAASNLEGLCTKDCTGDGDCSSLTRDSYCGAGRCYRICKSAADCPGAHCSSSGSQPRCLPGPAGLSGPCTENSQCLPGLFCAGPPEGIGGCTLPCAADAECSGYQAGSNNYCISGRCAASCTASECGAEAECIPNPGYCWR